MTELRRTREHRKRINVSTLIIPAAQSESSVNPGCRPAVQSALCWPFPIIYH